MSIVYTCGEASSSYTSAELERPIDVLLAARRLARVPMQRDGYCIAWAWRFELREEVLHHVEDYAPWVTGDIVKQVSTRSYMYL